QQSARRRLGSSARSRAGQNRNRGWRAWKVLSVLTVTKSDRTRKDITFMENFAIVLVIASAAKQSRVA
ncbi:MAG: hypothetical protein QFC78_11180, partial [Pseudomonadota bacterium]|nr:hypothetical protein [Pseudomonadota bacterium]